MKKLIMLSLLLSFGCSDKNKGELNGEYLMVSSCKDGTDVEFEPYKMNGVFFGLQQLGEVAFIRMQPNGKHLDRSDALVIQVNDTEFLEGRLGEDIYLDNDQIRAALHVLGSCPDNSTALIASNGFIRFNEFGVSKNDRVVAEFQFELIDDRTDELVGLNFEGKFDFIVNVGQPHQPFSGYNQGL